MAIDLARLFDPEGPLGRDIPGYRLRPQQLAMAEAVARAIAEGGQLVALEMVADPTDDGCEIRFADYRDVSGRPLPHRLEVRRGGELFAQIQWNQIELASSSEEKKP